MRAVGLLTASKHGVFGEYHHKLLAGVVAILAGCASATPLPAESQRSVASPIAPGAKPLSRADFEAARPPKQPVSQRPTALAPNTRYAVVRGYPDGDHDAIHLDPRLAPAGAQDPVLHVAGQAFTTYRYKDGRLQFIVPKGTVAQGTELELTQGARHLKVQP